MHTRSFEGEIDLYKTYRVSFFCLKIIYSEEQKFIFKVKEFSAFKQVEFVSFSYVE